MKSHKKLVLCINTKSDAIPYEIFGLVVRVINNEAVNEFYPPLFFHGKNRKDEFVSFTTSDAVTTIFSLLSAFGIKIVKRYFNRSLGGRRKGHKVKLLVSETHDIAFL